MTGLRVRATRRGFFGQTREAGDEFEIASKEQLAGLAVEQLAAYREQEAAAEKPRKGVIEAIDAAVAEKSTNA